MRIYEVKINSLLPYPRTDIYRVKAGSFPTAVHRAVKLWRQRHARKLIKTFSLTLTDLGLDLTFNHDTNGPTTN